MSFHVSSYFLFVRLYNRKNRSFNREFYVQALVKFKPFPPLVFILGSSVFIRQYIIISNSCHKESDLNGLQSMKQIIFHSSTSSQMGLNLSWSSVKLMKFIPRCRLFRWRTNVGIHWQFN